MAISTLAAIRQMVRQVTNSMSLTQLTNEQLDEYINTFILYDLPQNLRLFSLRKTLTFYTQPGVDTYASSTDTTDALYDFKNKYIAVHPPVYIAGYPAAYTQDRNVFYNNFPLFNTILTLSVQGDGTLTTFSGYVGQYLPFLPNSVVFSALDAAGAAMVLVDYPVSNVQGALGLQNESQTLPSPYGSINYVTGAYSVVFPSAVASATPLKFSCYNYKPSRPSWMLYFNNSFILRPVPNAVYPVQIEVECRPTELLLSDDLPDISQWWQYIALGASKKIFERRLDYDSVNLIMPTFKEQESLVLSTAVVQQTNRRTETIYTKGRSYGWGWYPFVWPY